MAHRPRRFWSYVWVVASLVLIPQGGASQQPESPPAPSSAPPSALPPAAPLPPPMFGNGTPVSPLAKQTVDAFIESAFGRDSAETRRPVRLWISDFGMVVAAKEAVLAKDGRSVRFVDVSLGLSAESKVLRGEESTVTLDQPIKEVDQITNCNVASVELRGKSGTILLTPQAQTPQGPNEGNFRTVTKMVAVTETIPILPPAPAVAPTPPAVTSVPVPPPPAISPVPQMQARRSVDFRFAFKIDPKASSADLLPAPGKTALREPIPFNEDLTKVAEIGIGEPLSKELPKQDAMEATAHAIAKINHLNAKKTDGFLLAMLDKRTDLRGMPFLMGDECRTREDQARIFSETAEAVQQSLRAAKSGNGNLGDGLNGFALATVDTKQIAGARVTQDMIHRAMVAALTQIVMPESAPLRVSLARCLSTIPHVDASKALARLAIFSPEDEVRAAAIEGLKLRRERDYVDVLMLGFRYPLPVVARRSAEALVKLECKETLADLVGVLEQPDPRLPVVEKRDGKDVTLVRELVKVNHHRNCLLCHAPGNTANTPDGVLKVAVPLPIEPLPKPADGGGYQKAPSTSDIVVRLDMTYLRQDFSLMMPVADAHPWPEMQRFDFLVRTRLLSPEDVQAYEVRRQAEDPGRPSVYHRAALFALREITGRDTEPTPQAWRKLLNLANRS
jgi:hypothetical protein